MKKKKNMYIDNNAYSELGRKSKTEIRYDMFEQYFEIKGRSQQACDDT